MVQCQCGDSFEEVVGPTHAYLGAVPGCWKNYGTVLACEYQDKEYWKVHRLTVDAYSCQHPGRPEPRTIQSINLHLVALCLVLERGQSMEFATQTLGRISNELNPRWIEPPKQPGELTLASVLGATHAEDHVARVEAYARSVWAAWAPAHELIHKYCDWILDSYAGVKGLDTHA